MAKMFPALDEEQLAMIPSQAEARIYRAFRDTLGQSYHVYHSIGWILRRPNENARDGEADFVVCHPDQGFLALEVKGGGVGFDGQTGTWHSVDRHGTRHIVKDPVKQALRAKYSVLAKLREHPRWGALRIGRVACGHGVFFPDISTPDPLVRPDLPHKLIGTAESLKRPQNWIETLFAYWGKESRGHDSLGATGMQLFETVFAHSFEVRPLLSQLLDAEEETRLRLTEEQSRILDLLQSRRRVAISGGAGTGKTLLAVEKAKRLAGQGFRTLLTCYNRPLADHLADVCRDFERLEIMSYHQLCKRLVDRAGESSGRDLLAEAQLSYPGTDLWNVQYPNALAYATEVLDERYDAVVCDEGQDFNEDYWLPLEMLLVDYASSPLYVFFDDNQNLYRRVPSFPIQDDPYPLTVNCRNTARIHAAASRFYKGVPVSPPAIQGREIETLCASNPEAQAKALHAKLTDMIAREGVSPADIAVLILDAPRKTDYYKRLRSFPLPRPVQWSEENRRSKHGVHLDTVNRFKGLEAPIVFLWGLDGVSVKRNQESLYVGLSRAKSLLVLVGLESDCRNLGYDQNL